MDMLCKFITLYYALLQIDSVQWVLITEGPIVVAGGSNYCVHKVECPWPNHQLRSILVQAEGYPQILEQLVLADSCF
jgi:hypothetical protein